MDMDTDNTSLSAFQVINGTRQAIVLPRSEYKTQ